MAKKQAPPPKAAPAKAPVTENREIAAPRWVWPLVIVLVSFLVYANTLGHDYALDDQIVITGNSFTQQGIKGIKDIFSHDSFTGFFGEERNPVAGGRYRPLSIATFAVEHSLTGGDHPGFSHFINVLLFSLTCLLLFLLLERLAGSRPRLTGLPFLATLLFAVHPIHTEAVANIKGRDEILALLFTLIAFITAYDYFKKQGIWRLAVSFVCFVLALLSKESPLPLLLLLPFTLLLQKEKQPVSKIIIASLPVLIATGIYFAIRMAALSGLPPADPDAKVDLLNSAYRDATPVEHIATAFYCLAYYVKLLFIPWPLTHDYYPYQVPLVGLHNPVALLGMVMYAGLAFFAIRGLLRKKIWGWAIAFYLLTIALVSNLAIEVGVFMAERFLFLPSVGFCVVVAWAFHTWLEKKRTVFITGASALLLVFAIVTIARNPVWKDNPTLFMTDVYNSPGSAKARTAGAAEFWKAAKEETNFKERNEMLQEALKHANAAVRIYPEHSIAWDIRGHILIEMKDYKEALKSYEMAVAHNKSPNYLKNLAIGANIAGDYQKSADNFNVYLKSRPNDAGAWFDLALACENGGKYPEAISAYKKSIDLNAGNTSEALGKIGMIYGRYFQQADSSIVYLEKARASGGKEESLFNNLGIAYGMKQDYAKSVQVLEEGRRLYPQSKEILPSLAVTYRMLGDSAKMREIILQMQGGK